MLNMSSKQIDLGNEGVKLQPDVKAQECFVAGCDELGSEFLPQRMQVPRILWCKPHAQMLASMISRRDYEDFVSALRELGVTKEPKLVTAEVVGDKRRCCVPRCRKLFSCGLIFEPYKNPGRAWVCVRHSEAANKVLQDLNGLRVLHELARKPRVTDPERGQRIAAIHEACIKHNREKDYLEAVCKDIQNRRITMLPSWLNAWERKGFRVESSDWVHAYKANPTAKKTIQKYISKYAKSRAKPANS